MRGTRLEGADPDVDSFVVAGAGVVFTGEGAGREKGGAGIEAGTLWVKINNANSISMDATR